MMNYIPLVGALVPRSARKQYPSTADMVLELNTITESTKDMTAQIEQYQGGLSNLLYLTKGTYKVYDSAMNAQKRVASTPANQERGEEDRVLAATYEIMNALNNALIATSSKVY
ncbi:hypothetical protein ASPBRDRAFT_59747 [Aspergillus brasiliensis CBS 101740]|uniref:Uncharacterized protein n=1 Tax=Aspergillus brasiliensis (strain CBS 101740 / IMI 381727 / IBT 21946) TaxID=767769 RepID=A0A1L9U3T9_ASPBC|nr:hypothetical protein ASPBRDRAFT_59747 [Aspergillus brasiliensis CBS 101740]